MRKYRLTIQNPLSVTWEKPAAPAAMATTTNDNCASDSPILTSNGAMSEAAMTMATVAEPWAIREIAENRNARITGVTPNPPSSSAKASPTPVLPSIPLKTPPAPVIRMMIPAGPSARVATSMSLSLATPRLVPKIHRVRIVESSSARIG